MRIKEIIKRFLRMFRVKDCTHVCLFCEYYDRCREKEEMKITSEWVDVSETGSEKEGEKAATSEDTA